MKKLLAAAASILLLCIFGTAAYASVPNPLAGENVGIRLLEDFSGYQELDELYGKRVSNVIKKSVALDNQSLLLTLNGLWFDTQIPISGFKQAGRLTDNASGYEPGELKGAQGIGLYIDTRAPLGIGEFTPSILALQGEKECHYNMAPESAYYLISSDGVTYEGTSNDTGWGEGIIGGIGIDFEGILLVPFTSLKYDGASLDPETAVANKLQLKGFSGDVRVDDIFLYGEDLADTGAESIRSFFTQPEKVQSPENYEITQRIKTAFGLDAVNREIPVSRWLIPVIAAAAVSIIGIIAAFFIGGRKEG